MPDDAPTPDELEQWQSAVPGDEERDPLYDVDEPLTPDEIEQRIEAGFDDEDQPVEGDEA